MADLEASDLVIEAVVENMALKKEIFAKLDQLCAPEVRNNCPAISSGNRNAASSNAFDAL